MALQKLFYVALFVTAVFGSCTDKWIGAPSQCDGAVTKDRPLFLDTSAQNTAKSQFDTQLPLLSNFPPACSTPLVKMLCAATFHPCDCSTPPKEMLACKTLCTAFETGCGATADTIRSVATTEEQKALFNCNGPLYSTDAGCYSGTASSAGACPAAPPPAASPSPAAPPPAASPAAPPPPGPAPPPAPRPSQPPAPPVSRPKVPVDQEPVPGTALAGSAAVDGGGEYPSNALVVAPSFVLCALSLFLALW
eukprot:CAMPEP_0177688222 /NCGR_PEP_ID=MMETSP0447-20121125/34545_1 /TAXON_ID=0 /ORGANISM="Stygamoeba regulata, Strain BSH-02190019" /LENGTH=249 /DNA_ID=CAMNT_0019198513 /DNA_START=38 /DNA_END=787 /DNA_ORIENTATION=+